METSPENFDLVVIGGAAGGGTMALRMAQAGWKVAVVEKAAFPRRKVCGEFLSATNLPLFEDLGIREAVLGAAGSPVEALAIYEGDTVIASPMPRIRGRRQLRGVALGRDRLDALLLDEAARHGAVRFQPARATSLSPGDDGLTQVRVEPATGGNGGGEPGRTLAAPVVVAAHGSWGASTLPSFPKAAKASPSDLFGFKAHFRRARLPRGLMPLFVFPGGYGGLVETHDGLVSFSCCVRRRELAAIREQHHAPSPGEAVVASLVERVRGMGEALGKAELEGAVLSTGPIRPGIREVYEGGVFKVGNAAGEAHPIIAEGITMAMQSSWILSEEWIAAGRSGDPLEVASRYRRRWRQAFAGRIRASFLFAALATNPAAAAPLRTLFETFPRLLTLGAEMSGKARLVVGR